MAVLVQIFLGIRVREGLEALIWNQHYTIGPSWFEPYTWRKINAGLVSLAAVAFLIFSRKPDRLARTFAVVVMSLTAAQIAAGLVLLIFELPVWMKPVHLGLTVALFAVAIAAILGQKSVTGAANVNPRS